MNLDISRIFFEWNLIFHVSFSNETLEWNLQCVLCSMPSELCFWRFSIGGATSWALKFWRLPPQWHSSKILSLSLRQPFYIQYVLYIWLILCHLKYESCLKRDFAVNFRVFLKIFILQVWIFYYCIDIFSNACLADYFSNSSD